MEYIKISENDYSPFHELASAYYREGEDANTAQEVIDSFVRLMFNKVTSNEIYGCLAKEGQKYIGFALWAIDSKSLTFSEMPGFGTILEIGFIPSYRFRENGKALVSYIENCFCQENIKSCYVSAYGPAQKFWRSCGYVENGKLAKNGLSIMLKTIG